MIERADLEILRSVKKERLRLRALKKALEREGKSRDAARKAVYRRHGALPKIV